LADSPDDSIALKSLFWSGEAKRYEGKYGESIEIHKKFVDLYPDHPYSDKVKLNIGISKFSQNSFTESEESLLELIQSPNVTTKGRALTVLGEIKLRKKEYKTSSQYFERGLNIPQLPIALKDRCYFGLGVSKFYMKNNVEALTELNKITSRNTQIDADKLNFYKGEINFFLGNYNDALSFYNKINTSDRSIQKNIIYGKAYSHFNQKDFTKAAILVYS
jgi:tetratricopeptide (TPR) repeat protein